MFILVDSLWTTVDRLKTMKGYSTFFLKLVDNFTVDLPTVVCGLWSFFTPFLQTKNRHLYQN